VARVWSIFEKTPIGFSGELSKGYKTKEKLQISSKYWALEIGK
jgi:hypothetical protein